MSNFIILILNVSISVHFCALPNALNAGDILLSFSIITREGIEYVVIIFQNVSEKILYINNYNIILSGRAEKKICNNAVSHFIYKIK